MQKVTFHDINTLQIHTTDDMIFTASHNEKIKHGKVASDLEYQEFVERDSSRKVTESSRRKGAKVSVSRILKNNHGACVDGLTILRSGGERSAARSGFESVISASISAGLPVEPDRGRDSGVPCGHGTTGSESVIYRFYTDYAKVQGSHRL